MEQYMIENAERYRMLVKRFVPPKAKKAEPKTEGSVASPDIIVTARLRLLMEEVAAVFPCGDGSGVLDVHELRRPPLGLAQLRSFSFQVDRIYDDKATTEHIYRDVVDPLVPFAWGGGVSTMFAYGQTGSGKTFTVTHLERLIAEELMSGRLDGRRSVHMSMVELVGNAACDLLNGRRAVAILEDAFGVTQLAGATEHEIKSAASMLALVETATALRRTEATLKNDASSRAHAVCRIRIVNDSAAAADDGVLYLVDLAGSEAARDSAGHDAQRMRETREVNRSLAVLKDCIRGKAEADNLAAAAAEGAKRRVTPPHVPFREAGLTKVLKHVFDPAAMRACKTVVVAGWEEPSLLCPTETGKQILSLPPSRFEARCLQTEGVTVEQAQVVRATLWRMHVDAQSGRAEKASSAEAGSGAEARAVQTSSRDPDSQTAGGVPFGERIRPGMVVSWVESRDGDDRGGGDGSDQIAVVLAQVGGDGDTATGRYRCATVCRSPGGMMAAAYEVLLWQQVVVEAKQMKAEVILEYDRATRLYHRSV